MSLNTQEVYEFVLQQMATESYFEETNLASETEVGNALRRGNNRDEFPVAGITRFTDSQVDEFLLKFQIVDQWSDNPTTTGSRPTKPEDPGFLALDGQQVLANSGLSATLIRRKDSAGTPTNEYTLAIRSTEFRKVADGGDRDRDVWGADVGGIVKDGFAFAQLDALESYYAWLKQNSKAAPR